MIWALKRKQIVEEELVLYTNISREMKKTKESEIIMYFHKVTLNVSASPLTFPTNSASAIPETSIPTPLFPPPP